MFHNHTTIEKLTAEVLINITALLDVASILQLSLSAKAFRHLIKDELVFRRLTERDYRVTDKQPEQSWVDVYKQKRLDQEETVTEEIVQQVTTTTTTTTTVQEEEEEEIIDTTEESATVQEPVKEVSIAAITQENATVEQVTAKVQEQPEQPEQLTEPIIEEVKSEEFKIESEPATKTPVENTESSSECPHLENVSDSINEIKRIIYKIENPPLCDLCLSNTSSYLNMSDSCHTEACRSCLDEEVNDEEHFPVQLELSTGDLYCFKCKESDDSPRRLDSEKAKQIMKYIKTPESVDDLDKRRKAEHQLYVQELRREDMSLKHYLVEKQWGRTWMLFRTREGSPLPGKITNQKLARMNGTLDPNIRLPMDKFRPSPETHADIVSERLWSYLVKAYGVQGRAYNEDDIIAPEYARLRVYVDDFKKSIHLYP